MAVSVVMPALELAQDTGKITSWLKKEGERIAKGEPLLEIETDKAVVEIESPGEGILTRVTAREGAVIPVGQTIAWIVLPGESVPVESDPAHSIMPAPHESRAVPVGSVSAGAQAVASSVSQLKISPKARRLAREHGIDLAVVRGSGAEGEILAADIDALATRGRGAASSSAPMACPAALEPPNSAMRLMAERTTASWTTVPHFFVVRDVDATSLNAARERRRASIEKTHGAHLTHTDLLIASVARTLKNHPIVNASWTTQGIRRNAEVNIGIAVGTKDAVVTGVIHSAEAAALGEIASQRQHLIERARAGRLRSSDVGGATFTISNLGMYHVDAFTAIVVPPQAAILAVGAITDRVVPVDGKPAIRPTMTLTLSCDHRVLDGARAADFLDDLVRALVDPEPWLEI